MDRGSPCLGHANGPFYSAGPPAAGPRRIGRRSDGMGQLDFAGRHRIAVGDRELRLRPARARGANRRTVRRRSFRPNGRPRSDRWRVRPRLLRRSGRALPTTRATSTCPATRFRPRSVDRRHNMPGAQFPIVILSRVAEHVSQLVAAADDRNAGQAGQGDVGSRPTVGVHVLGKSRFIEGDGREVGIDLHGVGKGVVTVAAKDPAGKQGVDQQIQRSQRIAPAGANARFSFRRCH